MARVQEHLRDAVSAQTVMQEVLKCPHYGICGGCNLQHIPYGRQVELKGMEVSRLFGREPDEIIPSPRISFYRNRMDYVVGPELEVGLRRRGRWWAFVDIMECLLQSPESNTIRNAFRDYIRRRGLKGYDTKRHEGLVRYLVIREGKFTGERMVAVITSRPAHEGLREFAGEVESIVSSYINGVNPDMFDSSRAKSTMTIAGKDTIEERLLGYRFRMKLNSFFQTNSYTAEIMLRIVLEESRGSKNVYDLYSGIGTFTVPLADIVEDAYGIESDPESVELARENARVNGSSPTFYTARVESMGRLDADTMILDPPRAGVHPRALRLIESSQPRRIIYASCSPMKQAGDIKKLKGYRLERLVMIDQFPHTSHVETIAILSK